MNFNSSSISSNSNAMPKKEDEQFVPEGKNGPTLFDDCSKNNSLSSSLSKKGDVEQQIAQVSSAALDAIAKSKGRRVSNHRNAIQRQVPASYQLKNTTSMASSTSSTIRKSVNDEGCKSTQLSRLEEEVSAKARGSIRSNQKNIDITKRPPPPPSTSLSKTKDPPGLSSPSLNIKRLNRMEADVAAKEKAKAGRYGKNVVARSSAAAAIATKKINQYDADAAVKAKARAARSAAINGVGFKNAPPSSSTALHRMENDMALKEQARASRVSAIAMSAIRDQETESFSANNDVIAKKLSKSTGGRSRKSLVVRPGAVSSNGDDSYDDRIAYKTGTSRLSGTVTTVNDNDIISKTKKKKDINTIDSGTKVLLEDGNADTKLQDIDLSIDEGNGDDTVYNDEDVKNSSGLAVAVAVNEEEEENVFIPSAIEYDPEAAKAARESIYNKNRVHMYGMLGCTLVIIIVACALGVMSIIENEKTPFPTMAPTCTRCPEQFEQLMELEVGVQKLNDPESPEHKAKEWIIWEDPMELEPTAPNLIQRFTLATLYFETHQLGDWRSCNRPGVQDQIVEVIVDEKGNREDEEEQLSLNGNDADECQRLLLAGIKVETFQPIPAIRWLSSYHECDWSGITCDEYDNVREINLHAQLIDGPFPEAVVRLPHIQDIQAYWNNMTGPLPDSVGALRNLVNIEVHSNRFTGTFPISWMDSRNLQLLNIAANSLTGELPSQIGSFRNLKGFFIYENNFSGTLPPELSQARTLSYARLHSNSITGTIPPSFGDMALRELWLNKNHDLIGTIPSELGKLSDFMSDLKLSQTSLGGTIPEEIFDLSFLWRLYLFDSNFTGTISAKITNLERLESLRMQNNEFSGSLPEDFSAMTNLIEVDISFNQLRGSVPESLCNLKYEHKLERLTADCLADPVTDEVAMQCDCCDLCCNTKTGECA